MNYTRVKVVHDRASWLIYIATTVTVLKYFKLFSNSFKGGTEGICHEYIAPLENFNETEYKPTILRPLRNKRTHQRCVLQIYNIREAECCVESRTERNLLLDIDVQIKPKADKFSTREKSWTTFFQQNRLFETRKFFRTIVGTFYLLRFTVATPTFIFLLSYASLDIGTRSSTKNRSRLLSSAWRRVTPSLSRNIGPEMSPDFLSRCRRKNALTKVSFFVPSKYYSD